jgi:hypothetical protein
MLYARAYMWLLGGALAAALLLAAIGWVIHVASQAAIGIGSL